MGCQDNGFTAIQVRDAHAASLQYHLIFAVRADMLFRYNPAVFLDFSIPRIRIAVKILPGSCPVKVKQVEKWYRDGTAESPGEGIAGG
jgi:hypothetical protein